MLGAEGKSETVACDGRRKQIPACGSEMFEQESTCPPLGMSLLRDQVLSFAYADFARYPPSYREPKPFRRSEIAFGLAPFCGSSPHAGF